MSSSKWIAALAIIAFVGVAVHFTFIRRNIKKSESGVEGWIWDGEMRRGATGNWVPGK